MKKRNKEPKDLEHYKGKIKELISENKSLRRQLKKVTRTEHNYIPLEHEPDDYIKDEDGMYEVKQIINCEACGKGSLMTVDFGLKKYLICNLCRFRKVKT